MARYFFHIEDSISDLDTEGVELADHGAAMSQAVVMMGELLRERSAAVVQHRGLKLIVTDQTGLIAFILDLSAVAAPAIALRQRA